MLTQILTPRMDFIHFIHGLSLFFIMALAANLFRKEKRLHWLWLGLFSAAMAGSICLFLTANATINGVGMRSVAWSLHALSYLFLALFGLHSLPPGRWRGVGYVVAGALLVLPGASAIFHGMPGFVLATRTGLGPCACLFALAGASRLGMPDRTTKGLVATLRPLLMGYIFAVAALPGLSLALAHAFGGQSNWNVLPAADLQTMLLAALAISTATAFARSAAFGSETGSEDRTGLHAYAVGVTAVGFAIFLGFAFSDTLGDNAEQTLKTELYMRVSAVGNAIEPSLVRALGGAPEDIELPAYKQLLRQLTKIRLANPDLRFVYLVNMNLPGRQIAITLDTEPPSSEDYAPPGEIYAEAPAELSAIFSSGKTELVGPYEDRWGIWLSGFSPVKDEYGAILGAVGMDIAARVFRAHVAANRLVGILITFLLAVIGAGIGLLIQRNRDLNESNNLLALEIEERQAAQRDLAESEKKYRNVVERAGDGIAILRDYTILYANPRLAEMLAAEPGELVGKSLDQLAESQCRQDLLDFYASRIRGEDAPESCDACLLSTDKNQVDVEINAGITPYRGEPAMLLMLRDVTQRKKAERELRESREKYRALSIMDDLTGLFNSRHFHQRIADEMHRTSRYDRPLSLILMDLDNFKIYNDTFGHLAGDRLLSGLGELLRESVRESDTAYRYGGEEFAVILPETDGHQANILAERIRVAVAARIFHPKDGVERNCTMSLGVALYKDGESPEDFVMRVDRAMYTAKVQGKNRTVFAD